MLKVCKATENEVWDMINFRVKSRKDCWVAMKFIKKHDFVNVDDPDYSKFDSWMEALSYRANREFN